MTSLLVLMKRKTMKNNYERLGNYIREVDVRNRNLEVKELLGVNIGKYFMPSVANVIGTDLSNYKIVCRNQFACNLMHVGRDEKIPIAILEDSESAIVSPAYFTFEISDYNVLLPQYLMIWFRKPEFDRETWFYTDGDVRGGMSKSSFLDMTLPIPPIEQQQKMVAEYEALSRRIRLNEQIITRLEETAQTLYRKMFVDGIDKENLPEGWRMGTLGEIGEIVGGATPLTDNSDYWCANGISWLSPADLSKQATKFISKGAKDITIKGYKSCSTKMLPKGSVLFSSRAPIGLMAISTTDLCTNQGFKSIVPNQNIGCEYVYYCLLSIRDRIALENEGSTFSEVSGHAMKEYPILIPKKDVISNFSKLIHPIFNQQQTKEQENKLLTKLQFLLLAKTEQ